MTLRMPRMKYAIDLFAGVVGMVFDRISGLQADEVTMIAESASTAEPAPDERDDLTKIGGIGPAFAGRLYEGGINTYADLAATTPELVREITHVAEWQGDPVDWIEQAKALA